MDFLSDLELSVISDRLNHLIGGMFINNIYSLDEDRYSFLLKGELASSINVHLKIGMWLSDRYLKERSGTEFLGQLRRFAEGRKIYNLSAQKGERIVFLNIGGGNIIFEFFGRGNMICTDENMTITCALREEEFRARSIVPGKKYALPKRRGAPMSEFVQLLYNESLPLVKHMSYNWSIPRKFMNEIFFISNVDPLKVSTDLNDNEKESIMQALKQIVQRVEQSDELFEYQDIEPVFSLIKLNHLSDKVEIRHEGLQNGLKEAFDKYIFELVDLNQERAQKQQELEKQYLEKAATLRQLAKAIMQYDSVSVKDLLSKLNAEIKSDGTVIIDGKTIRGANPASVASEIFKGAKSYEEGARKLQKSISRISSQERPKVKFREVVKREWYERYRWFITSSGELAVGGRDASSNESLLKKVMKPDHLVFHADIPGSPFFLVPQSAGEKSISEVAIATASFSRAWRAGLSSADVYYVKPDQVKFSAPSGEFLPRGGAILEGQKSYIKGVKLQLGVGLIEINSALKVFSAPTPAASYHCKWFVEIIPGRLPQSEAAKKISKMVMEAYGNVPSIEEFQKALPAGNTDIIGIRKRGDMTQ